MRRSVQLWLIMFVWLTFELTATTSQSQASVVAGPIVNPANGHFYFLLSNNTWTASEAEAVTLGGHLATIRNAAENDWVYNTFSYYSGSPRELWIGLYDLNSAGTFAWVSGESSTYTNWGSGQPDNIGSEKYVHIMSPTSGEPGLWNNSAVSSTPNGVAEVIKPLSSLAITGSPDSVYQISQASYTATATFSDSSTGVLTATWSVNPTTYASIDAGGILTTQLVPSDQTVTITASFTTGGVNRTATKTVSIVKVQIPGMVYFSDTFESGLGNWVVSGSDWAIINSDHRSGTHSITDSPSGNYPSNANSTITLAHPIDLTGASVPILSFWHKYLLNSNDNVTDHVFVEVSQDGGLTWVGATGGEFHYDSSTWTQVSIDLSAYKSQSILIRFRLWDRTVYYSDYQSDGWYIDDVAIKENDTANTAFPFFDNFESGLGSWVISGRDWALIDSEYRSAGHSIADSPSGNYPSNANTTITLAHPIDLSGASAPILSFWHKYFLNSNDNVTDHVFVEVSQDGGLTWAGATGGEFHYDSSTWTQVRIDLSAFNSQPILIRFRLWDRIVYYSDYQSDGWYIDDVTFYDSADVTPPETEITIKPTNPSSNAAPSFSFTSTEANSTFECKMDNDSFSTCISPKNFSVLAEGSHTFQVRASDLAGNTDATPATYTWTIINTNPPTIVITSPVAGLTNNKTPKLSYSLSNGTASVILDGNPISVANGADLPSLSEGGHSVTVEAIDSLGNKGSAYVNFTVDSVAPSLSVTDPAQDITTYLAGIAIQGTVSDILTTVTITITANGVTYTPQVTGGNFTQALSFTSFNTYSVIVTATDQAGNQTSVTRNIIYMKCASGDISGDGKVDISDALMALRIAVGLIPINDNYLVEGDVAPYYGNAPHPDRNIDISDALVILRKCVGLIDW